MANIDFSNRPGASITCQLSRGEQRWKLWEGEQWTKAGRVQLWTSNFRPSPVQRRELLSTGSTNDTGLGILTPSTSIPSISSRPPVLPPFPFARESRQSVAATPPTNVPASQRSSRTALFSASRETGLPSPAPSSVEFVPVDRSGNLGAVLEIPDPPSLVIFFDKMLLLVRGW